MKRLKVPICKALAVLLTLLVMLSSPVLPVSAEEIATPSDAVEWSVETDSEQDFPDEIPTEPSESTMHPIQAAVDALGYAHVAVQESVTVYSTAALQEEAFTIHGGVLLVTACIQQGNRNVLEVQFLTANGEAILAYADAADLPDTPMTETEIIAATQSTDYVLVPTPWESVPAFQVDAEAVQASTEISTVETPDESDEPVPSDAVEISETPSAEVIADLNITTFQPGDFALVTTNTRVFLEPDETAYTGCFVSEAVVQVESDQQDGWCKVRYLHGDDHADGTLKWTETGTVYVHTADLLPTEAQGCTVTDYADPYAVSALATDGFSLRSISMDLGGFTVGQTGLHGSSGKDSAYKQIATLPGRGKIYATPHYLEGYTVYCLEHLLPGPGENISGGGQQPTGPYMVVDLASYMSTPGYSGVMYRESTMHAIGWVLRHTVPFMELDRSDSNNRTCSRVAGQFAIREVIRQLEGSQYVRDYWNMEDFYAASDNAPAVYLAYARWLAQGGIARASVTGSITASNQQTSSANGMNFATVTLTTDADLMRISKACGTLTGHTAGEDASYYYLHSGNTVTLSSSATTFGMTVESISSPDEEASFLVGVPDAAIQKVLIPQPGQPYPLKSLSLSFEAAKGEIRVIKTDAEDGTTLAGATFELVSNGTTIATATTGADGVVTFSDIPAGTYTLREVSAPEGYVLSVPAEQTVTVASGQTSEAAFTNRRCTAKIRIVKTDALTGAKLTGAEFTITDAAGEIVATLTTDANGATETDWLRYGVYTVTETQAPEHYISSGFSTVMEAFEDGKTYAFTVENDPTKGYIHLTKTDSLDGTPLNGVRFDIYDASGEAVASMTTDENGIAVSPALTPGCYTVCEADAPEGYVWKVIQLNADVLSDETTDLTVTNKPIQGKIRIEKRDTLTGERLAGAEFTITDAEGETVAILTTDENGEAETDWLRYGVYTVTETKVPEHYVDSGFSCEVTINEEDMCTYLVDCDNEPSKGYIQLTKSDRLNGNPISGVRFDVFYDDQYGEGLATTMVTDENGVAVSEPLRKGTYIVREHGETAGYVFETIELNTTIHSDETTQLAVTNQPVQVQMKLFKRDADEFSGKTEDAPGIRGDGILTGAEFQIQAAKNITDRQDNLLFAKGEVVMQSLKTAGAEASVITDKLWPGVYEIVEITPPTGYQPSDKSIVVDASSAAKQSTNAIVTYEGVFTNEIKYGAQAIVKLLGDGTASADPTRVETPEPGAEFRVYLQKAGSFDNARKAERDYLITDKNGYAMTKALPYGVYVLEQVKGKEGYEIKGPITFEIDGTESLVNPPPLTLSDQPILYRLRFIKTDAVTGKTITLSNASFKLKDANGEYVRQTVHYPHKQEIDIFTTDSTGSVTLPETITWGLYFVEEIKAPEGYLVCTEPLPVFVGHEGDNPGQTYELEITIPNTSILGRILLDKKGLQLTNVKHTTDALGNEVHTPVYEEGYLAGAVFEVCAAEDVIGQDGTVWYHAGELVDTITTTASGGDASRMLPLGKYEVVEASAPAGYVCNSEPIFVELRATDSATPVVEVRITVQNDYLPAEITLFKEKEVIQTAVSGADTVHSGLTTAPGEGCVFGLFTAQDHLYAGGTLMVDTLVATGATDENGMMTFTGRYPHGEYYIRELYAPEGWKIIAEQLPITLSPEQSENNVIRVLLPEPIRNELIHTEVTLTKTDITGEKTLPGAVIEVYNAAGDLIYRDMTDEHGEIANIPVTPGNYTFREVYAPNGYALNEAVMHFTVSEDGTVTGDTAIRDDFSRFSIEKVDGSGKPLSDVVFCLVNADNITVQTAATDRNGLATFEQVPFGSYRIVETVTPAGYEPAEITVEVTVDGTFVNPEKPIATIVNVPNEVLVQKVDADGRPLSGATFGLFDALGEQFAVVTSDANGLVRFTKVPFGSYTLRELTAPDGYLLSKEEIAFTIDADYRSTGQPVATVTNQRKQVQFIKVDTSGKALPGVEFALINAVTHEVAETAVSNDRGEFIFTRFDYGDWIIRETAAPEGYSRMEDYLLHVDENWSEPEPIQLVNIPSTYLFYKCDNRRNPLPGVTFAVEDESGNTVQEVTSAENGVVTIEGLAPGKYTIREIATVEGFTVSGDTITVVIDENYTVPTKLKRFVNYPGIATGVDVSPTMLTWVGVGLTVAAAFVLIVRRKRK